MAINKSTDAGLAEEVKTFYDRTLLTRMVPNVCWPLFGQARPMPQQEGQTINWRGFESLPVMTTALEEGVTPDGESLDMTHVEAVPVQYGDFVRITDVVNITSFDPVLAQTAEVLGEQAAASYDTIVRDVVIAGTNVQYAGSNIQRDAVASDDLPKTVEFQKAARTMHTNKVKKITSILNATDGVGTTPVPACYVGIIGSKTLYDLKTESGGGFTPVHKYSNPNVLLPNEVGSVDEFRLILSDNPAVFEGEGSGQIDVYATMLFGRDAFGVVSLEGTQTITKDFGQGDDPLNQRMTMGWKAFFTAVIINELAALRLEHACSA